VNCPPFSISLSFWVELVGACNSIDVNLPLLFFLQQPVFSWILWYIIDFFNPLFLLKILDCIL
jgi:hypothetical protein